MPDRPRVELLDETGRKGPTRRDRPRRPHRPTAPHRTSTMTTSRTQPGCASAADDLEKTTPALGRAAARRRPDPGPAPRPMWDGSFPRMEAGEKPEKGEKP